MSPNLVVKGERVLCQIKHAERFMFLSTKRKLQKVTNPRNYRHDWKEPH